MITANLIAWLLPWIWGLFQEMFTVKIIAWLFPWIWGVFQEMITVKIIVWLLPWMWGLFKVFFCGKYWYITCMIPYAFLIEYWKKITNQNKINSANIKIHKSNLIPRNDDCVLTKDIDCIKNNYDELNTEKCQNIVFSKSSSVRRYENRNAHGDKLAKIPYNIKAGCQLYSPGNPFFSINDAAALLTAGEGSPPLLPSNPFFRDCINNPFIDTSDFFPNDFNDVPFYPIESEIYCKEWIEQHREYFTNTAPSF
ncbi:hypothetical protein AVEN_41930-1 [Araneus ventricosus]|uniref:Uncharacterized protein n=1 Tax=Araneus ventricosus TaxID=182803 RepID=A0A4Y2AEC5_ARAVE|nr:hypothetical protein AVEN_41930-1 [Araneus ventricosus]